MAVIQFSVKLCFKWLLIGAYNFNSVLNSSLEAEKVRLSYMGKSVFWKLIWQHIIFYANQYLEIENVKVKTIITGTELNVKKFVQFSRVLLAFSACLYLFWNFFS